MTRIRDIRLIPLAFVMDDGKAYGMARDKTSRREAGLIEIETEDGVIGIGEAFGPTKVTAGYLELIRDVFIGRTLFEPELVWSDIISRRYHLGLQTAACGSRRERDAGTTRSETRVNGLTAEQAREVLAHVGDEEIALGEFGERLAAQSPYLRARFNSPERRREMLDNMIRFELLVQEARRRGLDHNPAVARLETQALVDELLRVDVDSRINLQSITDAETRAYYDAHPEEWNQPEQERARATFASPIAPLPSALSRASPRRRTTRSSSVASRASNRTTSRRADRGAISVLSRAREF